MNQPPTKSDGKKGFSVAGLIQFLGASSIVAIATWSLNNIISAKSNQQQQLNTFINTISDFMIQNNLDGQTSGKPLVPAVSRAARGYALNTLNTFDGVIFIEDKPKKLALLKFLYDSELIGFCKDSATGKQESIVTPKCFDTRIKLRDARLTGLKFSQIGSILNGIDLSGANLSGSNLANIDLTRSRFKGTLLRFADFSNSILQHANFYSAFLIDANLVNADLTDSILDRSQLCGADLTGVTGFQSAKLNQVAFDAQTKLPKGGKELLLANGGIYVGPRELTKDCQPTRILD
ncbi:MAG: pentapeptide repeat-containing protein [Synechococcaceae cyanobacterium]|nr:pentapeptide repeat-containing protein [Synechococcaceae cyanobacterium]